MSSQPAPTQDTTIYCAACGHPNPSWRSHCEKCTSQLVARLDRPADTYTSMPPSVSAAPRERPGCVTLYAALLFLGAALVAIVGFVVAARVASSSGNVALSLAELAGLWIVAALYFLLARGLWRLKNWARIIIIVIQGLGVVVDFLLLCVSVGGSGNAQNLISSLVGLVTGGIILYWFSAHGEYFS